MSEFLRRIPLDAVPFGRAHFLGVHPVAYSSPEGVLVTPKGTRKRMKIFFSNQQLDPNTNESLNEPYDPETILVEIQDENETIILSGSSYIPDGTGTIKREDVGAYYVDWATVGITGKRYDFTWSY